MKWNEAKQLTNTIDYFDQKFQPVVEEDVKPVEIVPVQSEKPSEEDLSWEDKGEKIGDEITVEKENDAGNLKKKKLRLPLRVIL